MKKVAEFQSGRGGIAAAILDSGGVGGTAAPPAVAARVARRSDVSGDPSRKRPSHKMAGRKAREETIAACRRILSEDESDMHESDCSSSSAGTVVVESDMEIGVQSLKRKGTTEDKPESEDEEFIRVKRKNIKAKRLGNSPKKLESTSETKTPVEEKTRAKKEPKVPENSKEKTGKNIPQGPFAKAKELESDVIALCMDLAKNVSREQANLLANKISAMSGLVQELLLRNSFLEGRLAAGANVCDILVAKGDVTRQAGARGGAVPASASGAQRSGTVSYSAAVSGGKPMTMASTVRHVIKTVAKKPEKNVVEIFPTEGESSDKTKEALFSLVNPRKSKLRIKNIRKIKDNGIAVETEDKEGLQTLIGNEKLASAGLKVVAGSKRRPRLQIYDVPRETEESEILSSIRKQNLDGMTPAKVAEEICLAFKTGPKTGETVNWVIEATPEMRETLLKKGKLYIGWRSCRVADFAEATRCFKCQSFGHIAKYCRKEKEVCGHCAEEGHTFANCTKKNTTAICTNCKSKGKPFDHESKDKKCPMYRAALTRVISQTNYG